MRRARLLPFVALLLLVPLAIPAGPTSAAPEPQPISQVRFVHALPGVPPVDVFVDGLRTVPALAFGVIAPYVNLPAGPHSFGVVPAGAVIGSAILAADWDLAPGQPYTIMATQPATGPAAPIVLLDSRFAPVGGPARIRFVHASPNTPAVDMVQAGGAALFTNVGFGETTPYLDMPAGTITLEVRQAGTDQVILAMPDAVLAAGTIYTFGAIGLLGGTPPLGTLTLVDS